MISINSNCSFPLASLLSPHSEPILNIDEQSDSSSIYPKSQRLAAKLVRLDSPASEQRAAIPADLEVEQSGVCFIDGRDELDYLWYRLREVEGGREYAGFRVVRLLQLTFLPLEARSDPGLLQKMRTVLRGLYGSQVSFLYLAAGIFNNQQPPVGIIQCYGVSAFAATLEEACARSMRSLAALKAAMSGAYRQVRLEP